MRLAALDSASPPRGPAQIAEADSRMLAALPLGSSRSIADPFEPTAELVALLQLRKSQIAAAQADAPQFSERLRALLRGRATPRPGLETSHKGSNLPLVKRRHQAPLR